MNHHGQLGNEDCKKNCSHTYEAAYDEVCEEIVAEVGHPKRDPVVAHRNYYKSLRAIELVARGTWVHSDMGETCEICENRLICDYSEIFYNSNIL